MHDIVLLPGDGVGPEVTAAARQVLEVVSDAFGHDFRFSEHLIGGAAIDATGEALSAETLKACQKSDAVFLGAVGGPKWDGGKVRPEQGLLALRKGLGLFANLRPTRVTPALEDRSPLKPEIVRGVDILIVRELTGGVYFGEKKRSADKASDLCAYTVEEIERVTRVAFRAAQGRKGRVTSIDKANVMETGRLWRETVTRIQREEFPRIELEHALVDSAAMHLITRPREFDVILTENMFGDILSDEVSVLAGSIGLLGSASLGATGPGLFEPIHGSAPDIAGQDRANPMGAIASAAMLLRHGLGLTDEADTVEAAIASVLTAGTVTRDLGGEGTCSGVARIIAERVRASRWSNVHRPQMHWA
jgi:3-isopropylmalate dehydrogenase